ncbi:MAG: polysaccharide deacetylase family protein [Meiothermus sp.]|uniref:polysaccharide deacetylase family protein n=1 Tax=Meiothermus sp. TaxID=1955249 RepID=UPI0025F9DFC3|nr:polysaccharide deacetylase family protein [Meiothermus sp.]MCS7068592.1 polysaccharide deacetylase family protein [Meiothermus sp.]MDW8425052.1 polysaccharide deacetylase family protein [Meiothermus sp.]
MRQFLVQLGVLVLLGGMGWSAWQWFGFLRPGQDFRALQSAGIVPLPILLERTIRPPKARWDAATQRLKAQLLEAAYRPLDPRAAGEAIVLNYHDVFPKRSAQNVWWDITPQEFEAQLAWLKSRGARFISLDELRRHLTQNTPLPKNAVALTFDDNHQGFYDHIYPILKREKIPAAMFVHTDFVGRKGPRARMDWATLRTLDREGLVTIGSHTVSHRDLTQLPLAEQRRELLESKWALERELGRPVSYIAYPEGKADAVTLKLAREAGYTMGFTIDWRLPGDSPDMLAVGRYVHTQMPRAWYTLNPQDRPQARTGIVERRLKEAPVRLEYRRDLGVRWALVRGGRAESRLSSYRESVRDFVEQAGAVAGINGTFFADPYLKAQDNTMVGPVVAAPRRYFIPERNPYVLYRIVERPLVAWNRERIVFVPLKFDMNRPDSIRRFMPDFTDLFVGGVWMVRGGKAVWPLKNPPSDHWEPRPRVFFGYAQGEPVLGASLQPVSTALLARMAAAAGVEEAVLLDSGYSTSLVYQGRLIAVGRRWEGVPSRPVPHAIVLHGALEQAQDPAATRRN